MSDADTIELAVTEAGIALPVKVQPRARQNAIAGVHAVRLKVSVTQVPEKGKANAAVADVISRELGLKNSQISLTAGTSNPLKTFTITGTSTAELRDKIERSLESFR